MIEVNASNVDEILKDEELILIDFFADWCYKCQFLLKSVKFVEENLGNKIKTYSAEVNSNPRLIEMFQVSCLPMILIMKNRKILTRVTHAISGEALLETLKNYL